MTTTLERAAPTRSNDSHPPRLTPRPRLNRSRLLLGIFLIATLSLAFAVLYSNVGSRQPVLAIARPVNAGQKIRSSDLSEVRVSLDPALKPIAASERATVEGRVAAVNLVPGTLLTRAELATGPALDSGRSEVGLALKPGQFPPGLRVGDHVSAVLLVAAAAGAPSDHGGIDRVIDDATVTSLADSGDASGATVVGLDVSSTDAPAVAAASAANRVTITRQGG
jgi:hypothetical protein